MKKFFPLILFFLIACNQSKIEPVINTQFGNEKIPVQESWNSKVYIYELNKKKAIVYSTYLKKFEKPAETLLENMKVEFYDENENLSSVLTSRKGRIDDKTKDMFALDSVIVKSDSGITLYSDELMWKNKDRKIVSTLYIKIITKDETIEGYGFESDQNLKNYKIFEPIVNSNKKVEK